jgi:hypothetical protein
MGIALVVAIFKDFVLDLAGVGSLPGIGFVITSCVSFIIGIMLARAGSGGRQARVENLIKKIVVLGSGTVVEGVFFGLNFLPLETLIVIVLYRIIKKEKAAEARSLAAERKSQAEAY